MIFNESLVTKCLFLSDGPCTVRPILIDINPVTLKCYPFMISLNKCIEICNVLCLKICLKNKDIIVKAFNMITNKNEPKPMAKHISCDRKCK